MYLDYTGGGLYAESQLAEHFALLRGGVFGNPHSVNPTSAASSELLERARARVLPGLAAGVRQPSGGAVRASVGLASNFADVDLFVRFAKEFIDLVAVPEDLPPRIAC